MELNNIHVLRRKPCLTINVLCCLLCHGVADNFHDLPPFWLFKSHSVVRAHTLANDLHCLSLQIVLLHKLLRANNCSTGSVTRGATLELSQRVVNFGAGQNLIQRIHRLELRVRVVRAVLMILLYKRVSIKRIRISI